MPIYVHECECGKTFERIDKIENAGKSALCTCGRESRQVIVPMGYAPWKPFYCETQGRQFDTRESYQRYCRSKGLEGITAREYRDISQEAAHLASVERQERRERSER